MLSESWNNLGEFVRAREHQEQQLALYASHRRSSSPLLSPATDPGVHGLSFAAVTLWQLGYPDRARRKSDEALALAQELAHPHSLALALRCAALLYQFRRETEVVKARAEAVIALAREQGFPFWVPLGMMARGGALAEQGQEEEGIQQLQQGMAILQGQGVELFRLYYLALLAAAYSKVGRADNGLAALADAPALVEKTGDRRYEAELYRLKGELTLQSKVQGPKSKVEEAEAYFLKAIEISRRQQAKSLELRAVMSLSRLWQQQGERQEAHSMLSEIYDWFTEGFDTKDLQEAKVLLEELT
jgi:predicted ATPase